MTVDLRNVASLPEPQGYHHVAIAPVGRTVYLAGQSGTGGPQEAPGTLAQQVEQALLNVASALDAAGASAADLVKLTILVVDWDQSKLAALASGMTAAARTRPLPPVPTTLIGVQSLFFDDMLVEIEGVAVLPAVGPGSSPSFGLPLGAGSDHR